ncbi:solute carrier family 23 protein [Fusobacterium necrophorum]|uniref:solute carrier family 23 protein n=1 Tax=Fusobacterium necrophorum TaxID=859 RepID=UPI0030AC3E7E
MTRNKSPYDIDGIPAFREALPLGLQHILAMFVANITPIMIVGGALHLPAEEIAILIQASMLVAGLNTFIQTYRVDRWEQDCRL